MENLKPHLHNGTDSDKLFLGDSAVNAPQEPLTTGTSSTAGATYTATEQAMINNLKTRVAEIETVLQSLGLLK
jgi:hypothetical protein